MDCPNSNSIRSTNLDLEREEGEIIDDVDDLSDISSEEEYLLRERLQVLENYNNVLERKQAKDLTLNPGKKINTEISTKNSKFCDNSGIYNNFTIKKYVKPLNKYRKKDEPCRKFDKRKSNKKRPHHSKKKQSLKVISESSEESDEENKVKRRKLENAVTVNRLKNDSSSLKTRLTKMLCSTQQNNVDLVDNVVHKPEDVESPIISIDTVDSINITVDKTTIINNSSSQTSINVNLTETVNNSTTVDDFSVVDQIICEENGAINKSVKTVLETNDNCNQDNSDDDLELLRQNALQTKTTIKCSTENKTTENITNELENKPASEDEDSDTTELRMICLKSALLKRAIENKKKEKLRKRLSQSSMQESFLIDDDELITKDDADNNTDIESVDMDIGSDGDDKCKESVESSIENSVVIEDKLSNIEKKSILSNSKEDEPDEDEDLLRAKLLTSLSKNLPNLVEPLMIGNIKNEKTEVDKVNNIKKQNVANPPQEKKFIINIGDSDSEGEHEATKNLTKMHIKLTEQVDFEQKLDLFLKSTRLEVENQKKLPDVVQEHNVIKPVEKFVPKAVNHLPKSEQIEYKNLVKRMAELEKIKKARQATINNMKNAAVHHPLKETLKPRNITIDSKLSAISNLDEQIALSRKNIAAESSSILKLKEEGTKLSQKYKIVVTELRNITTAISLNNKQQRAAQTRLARFRAQHQLLLKSTSIKHSKANYFLPPSNLNNNKNSVTKLQKENNPIKEEYKNTQLLKSVKVSVVNDLNNDEISAKHSIQIDVTNNKKTVKLLSPVKDRNIGISGDDLDNNKDGDVSRLYHVEDKEKKGKKNVDDYTSPLQALQSATWEEDPNAVLCPFDIGGNCKDSDCKYLHPKIPSVQ